MEERLELVLISIENEIKHLTILLEGATSKEDKRLHSILLADFEHAKELVLFIKGH